MFKNIKDYIMNIVASRLFVLVVVFIFLAGVLINRIFILQIVKGESYLNNYTLKIRRERSIASTRGNIYDRNGNLLAYNELAYNVTIEDVFDSGKTKNEKLNQNVKNLISIIEKNGNKVRNDFNIVIDQDGRYKFTVEDKQLRRFLADVYGHDTIDKLTYAEETSTPEEVVRYLAGVKKYELGTYKIKGDKKSFIVGDGYSKEELLKMITIRYAMSANSYQKYIPTVVASDVNEKTVAGVLENSDSLEGVSIAEDTIRKYVDSVYFSHILGYTGKISQDELDQLNKTKEVYSLTDMIGKAGIEQVMETDLQGKKGSEVVYVNNLGKVIETSNRVEPTAGNNLYLSIDMKLQKAVYNILEQKIAGILVSKIQNVKDYTPSSTGSASDVIIPIDNVYYALINNSVIDTSHFSSKSAGTVETQVYRNYVSKKKAVFETLRQELTQNKTPYKALTEEYQGYETYIVSLLESENIGILDSSKIDESDEIYAAWKTDESISLAEFLQHAIAMNWIDVTKLDMDQKYADSEEIYKNLTNKIISELDDNTDFAKKIYKYMIKDNLLSGKDVCNLLMEQNVVDVSAKDKASLESGKMSAYNFMLKLIENLSITPAQLALDPCSGSVVMTDVNTGEVLALVTYPGYDTNRLANNIDADYYSQLQNDLSKPMWNYATQQKTAPGSTFKMVSAIAGLQNGVITPTTSITCEGIFTKLDTPHKCWIYPSTHGALNVTGAIEHSCNYFFYEVGYRLSMNNGVYDSNLGVKKLAEYADQFGLSDPSGIEIPESTPQVSDKYSVPSAIGQGTHNYTTVGLARYVTTVANSGTCFDLSLLDKLTDSSGNLLKDYKPKVRNKMNIPQYEWNAVHAGMRKVIEDKEYYKDLGVEVAGKTGTAQEIRTRANHALFVGYAPYETPKVSIATRIAFGYTSDYAAEVSRDVFKYYFGLEDEESILTGTAAKPEATGAGGD